uniref:helix-turn-helix domain-containing protein n=2 Tax=Eubacteriales incertae sedis TaxID=538999 RepID=UPI0040289E14
MTKELGKRIRTERIDKKMTQEELAERAGLHPTYIGQVERGEKSLTITSLEKIV